MWLGHRGENWGEDDARGCLKRLQRAQTATADYKTVEELECDKLRPRRAGAQMRDVHLQSE